MAYKKMARRTPVCEIDTREVIRLDITHLRARQVRGDNIQRRLNDAVARFGITEPIIVRPFGREGSFLVIDGARRVEAARACGLSSLPCVLETPDDAPLRLSGTLFAQAEQLAALIDARGWTQQEAAERLGLSQSTVANKLRLLRFTPDERAMIEETHLSERHARALLTLSAERRSEAIEQIRTRSLTVAEAEAMIEQMRREAHRIPGRGAIRDIGIFYNSLDRALSILHDAGMTATLDRAEKADGVTVTIHVSRETLRV